MNRIYGQTLAPRIVTSREHPSGGADVDVTHVVAADHPNHYATSVVGLIIETAEGPCYANRHGAIHGPYDDAAEALTQLTAIHAEHGPKKEEGGDPMMNWRQRAACREADPELFFPVGDTGPALNQETEAKAVCSACPVAGECLAWALDTGVEGIWGGTTTAERRELRHNQRDGRGPGSSSGLPEPRPIRRDRDGILTRPGTADSVMLRDLHDDGYNVRTIEARTGYDRYIVGDLLYS